MVSFEDVVYVLLVLATVAYGWQKWRNAARGIVWVDVGSSP
jgi:hypothetical protein